MNLAVAEGFWVVVVPSVFVAPGKRGFLAGWLFLLLILATLLYLLLPTTATHPRSSWVLAASSEDFHAKLVYSDLVFELNCGILTSILDLPVLLEVSCRLPPM